MAPVALPPWLAPSLLSAISHRAEQDMATGASPDAVRRLAFEAARCAQPAMPMPHLAETVEIALWIARADGGG